MPSLTILTPEIRNEIYDLLVVREEPILIASPRKIKRKCFWRKLKTQTQRHTNFASLLRVGKQISREAKTVFYARNTFIIGSGRYGSTRQANIHGFRNFIVRVPKHCLALIRRVELDLCMLTPNEGRRWACAVDRLCLKWELDSLGEMCDGLLKYFTRLESISAAVLPLYFYCYKRRSRHDYENDDLRGDFAALSAPILKLLALPSLKQLHIKFESARNIRKLVEAVLEGKEEARDMVTMVKRYGSFVSF